MQIKKVFQRCKSWSYLNNLSCKLYQLQIQNIYSISQCILVLLTKPTMNRNIKQGVLLVRKILNKESEQNNI